MTSFLKKFPALLLTALTLSTSAYGPVDRSLAYGVCHPEKAPLCLGMSYAYKHPDNKDQDASENTLSVNVYRDRTALKQFAALSESDRGECVASLSGAAIREWLSPPCHVSRSFNDSRRREKSELEEVALEHLRDRGLISRRSLQDEMDSVLKSKGIGEHTRKEFLRAREEGGLSQLALHALTAHVVPTILWDSHNPSDLTDEKQVLAPTVIRTRTSQELLSLLKESPQNSPVWWPRYGFLDALLSKEPKETLLGLGKHCGSLGFLRHAENWKPVLEKWRNDAEVRPLYDSGLVYEATRGHREWRAFHAAQLDLANPEQAERFVVVAKPLLKQHPNLFVANHFSYPNILAQFNQDVLKDDTLWEGMSREDASKGLAELRRHIGLLKRLHHASDNDLVDSVIQGVWCPGTFGNADTRGNDLRLAGGQSPIEKLVSLRSSNPQAFHRLLVFACEEDRTLVKPGFGRESSPMAALRNELQDACLASRPQGRAALSWLQRTEEESSSPYESLLRYWLESNHLFPDNSLNGWGNPSLFEKMREDVNTVMDDLLKDAQLKNCVSVNNEAAWNTLWNTPLAKSCDNSLSAHCSLHEALRKLWKSYGRIGRGSKGKNDWIEAGDIDLRDALRLSFLMTAPLVQNGKVRWTADCPRKQLDNCLGRHLDILPQLAVPASHPAVVLPSTVKSSAPAAPAAQPIDQEVLCTALNVSPGLISDTQEWNRQWNRINRPAHSAREDEATKALRKDLRAFFVKHINQVGFGTGKKSGWIEKGQVTIPQALELALVALRHPHVAGEKTAKAQQTLQKVLDKHAATIQAVMKLEGSNAS